MKMKTQGVLLNFFPKGWTPIPIDYILYIYYILSTMYYLLYTIYCSGFTINYRLDGKD